MSYDESHIEKYWLGKLQPEEVTAFEAEMERDTEFKEEVESYEDIFTGLEGLQFRNKIDSWSQEAEKAGKVVDMPGKAKVRSMRTYRPLALAASLALIVVAGYWFGLRPYNNSNLYAGYYDDTNTFSTIRSAQNNTGDLQTGFDLYLNKDYEKASAYFNTIPSNDVKNKATAEYYESHSLMKKGKFQAALAPLNSLMKKDDPRYDEEAEWLRILCYLKLDDRRNLNNELVRLSLYPDAFNHKKAVELKKKLDSFQRSMLR